jgi:hypothetical protein
MECLWALRKASAEVGATMRAECDEDSKDFSTSRLHPPISGLQPELQGEVGGSEWDFWSGQKCSLSEEEMLLGL